MSDVPMHDSVLVVEDDPDLLAVLPRILSTAGYMVRTASDGEDGLSKVLDDAPAIAILDVGLPKLSGYELARELRSRGYQFPVLMLTARVSVDDKVSGLDAGADDYLAKPFEYAELLARVKALLRRSTITAGSSTMRVRDLTVDPVARRVERAGKVIDLTQKEYALLEYLVRSRDEVVSRERILNAVWDYQFDPRSNVVDVCVARLRRKLEAEAVIETVRGGGYRLVPC